jgi:hypothetical protein
MDRFPQIHEKDSRVNKFSKVAELTQKVAFLYISSKHTKRKLGKKFHLQCYLRELNTWELI